MSWIKNFLIIFFTTVLLLWFHSCSMASDDLSVYCNSTAIEDHLTERSSMHIPPEAMIKAPDKICLGQTAALEAQSYSRDNLSLKYHWDFGDGTQADARTVNKKFEKTKTYRVTLTARDSSGHLCNSTSVYKDIQVIAAPVAVTGEKISTCLGESVEFQGSSANKDALVYFAQWKFGDGKRERGLKVRHVYNRPGTYHATLTLQDPFTIICPESTAERTVTVSSSPEIALKSSSSGGVTSVNQEIVFDALSAHSLAEGSRPVEYFWDFGEGDAVLKNGPHVTHTFRKPGHYKVSVIVNDNQETACSTNSSTINIQVNELNKK